MMEQQKFTVIRGANGRYVGATAAARGLGVTRQAISDFLRWGRPSIGPRKRARLVLVDWPAGGDR